ncbi:hypothetical protein KBD45_06005 [Candidatus Dojkabacteria bacterium]|nr:hypothetical protein [Candidatus Dojkabacteria bacterium]
MNRNIKYDKKKLIIDLASTPLISIANGEIEFNINDYLLIEEIKVNNN